MVAKARPLVKSIYLTLGFRTASPVFTGVLKLYLRDGQRASCDKPHAQVVRDLGRKLHVFSTEESRLADGHKKY
jgi:hypothetical protein